MQCVKPLARLSSPTNRLKFLDPLLGAHERNLVTTITEALTVEHTLLNSLFDEILRLLPDVRTVQELRLLTRLVEGVLAHHAELEDNLAYSALNQALTEKGKFDQLQLDHRELDERNAAASAAEFSEAVGA